MSVIVLYIFLIDTSRAALYFLRSATNFVYAARALCHRLTKNLLKLKIISEMNSANLSTVDLVV